MDSVLITTAADGVLTVHRETCKKIEGRETQGVDEVLTANPGSLTTAKKASCCKPTDSVMEEVEQAGWDALEAQTAAEATVSDEAEADVQADADEDLIGETAPATDEAGDDEEDLIGTPAPAEEPAKGKTAGKVAAARTEAREVNGQESLQKVAAHLGLDLGENPVFPGFGKAFKTAAKQSVYINSKGNADVRATDAEQAAAFASLDHVERRSGNYVRINLAAL